MDTQVAPGGEKWNWRITPPEGWLVVPALATEGVDVVGTWEREVVEMFSESIEQQVPEEIDFWADGSERIREAMTESVASLRALADGVAEGGQRVVAAYGVADRTPVPVLVSMDVRSPDEADDTMLEVLGAKGGGAPISQPSVEYFDFPDDGGDGVRVSRMDITANGIAWVSIGLGRRVEYPDVVADTVLFWRSQDLMVSSVMRERLDELMRAVTIDRVDP